ncbi:hypothetical protein D3C85_1794590 [compost metagenome]
MSLCEIEYVAVNVCSSDSPICKLIGCPDNTIPGKLSVTFIPDNGTFPVFVILKL